MNELNTWCELRRFAILCYTLKMSCKFPQSVCMRGQGGREKVPLSYVILRKGLLNQKEKGC